MKKSIQLWKNNEFENFISAKNSIFFLNLLFNRVLILRKTLEVRVQFITKFISYPRQLALIWAQNPVLLLISCAILGQLLNLSESQFVSSLKWERYPPLSLLQGFHEMMHAKHIVPLPEI